MSTKSPAATVNEWVTSEQVTAGSVIVQVRACPVVFLRKVKATEFPPEPPSAVESWAPKLENVVAALIFACTAVSAVLALLPPPAGK